MAQVLRQLQEKQVAFICCVCGDVRDDIEGNNAWSSLKAHLSRYGIQEQNLTFSQTFCPCCFIHCKDLLGLAPERLARAL